jgi:uncharacterized lipoprotein YajG
MYRLTINGSVLNLKLKGIIMKKILLAALIFLFAGCSAYWHDNSRNDKRSHHQNEIRGTGNGNDNEREHQNYR